MKIMIINGPNLNRLGKRKAEHYGTMTLDQMNAQIKAYGETLALECDFFQSNHEGEIIDCIHSLEDKGYAGCVINAGAYTHYSYAIRDAIESMAIPFCEAHLSNIHEREPFRAISVLEPVCIHQFYGLKEGSYMKALDLLKATVEHA